MGTRDTAGEIQRLLRERLQVAHLDLDDESARHVGHAGAGGGAGHFRLRIVSTSFQGLKPLQRHRLVNDVLAPLLIAQVHALSLETLTPEEFVK